LEAAQQLAQTEKTRAEEQAQSAQNLRRRAYILGGVLVVAAILAVVAVFFAQQSNENADAAEENALLAQEGQALANTREAEAQEQQGIAEEQKTVAEEQRTIAEVEARAAQEAYSQSLAAHVDNALEAKDSATALALALEASVLDDPPALTQRMLRQAAYAPGPRQQFLISELFPDVDGRVYSLAISPNESVVLLGFEDGSLILWDLSTSTEIHSLEGHSGIVRTAAFSPDGQTALSGSSDRSVILWDLGTGREIRRFQGHNGWVQAVTFDPDGITFVSGGYDGASVDAAVNPGELIMWDLETGQEIRHFEGLPSGVQAAAISPDGQTLLASSGFFGQSILEYGLILWDVATGEIIRNFDVDHSSFDLAFSPDGGTAVTGGSDNNLHLWDLESGEKVQTLTGHQSVVTTVAFTSDGNKIMSGDWNSRIFLWDLHTGEPIIQSTVHNNFAGWAVQDAPPLNLGMVPGQNKALSSAGAGSLVLWDLTGAAEIRRFEGTGDTISAVAFTPNGEYVLTAPGMNDIGAPFPSDPAVRLWNVETGENIRALEGDLIAVTQIAVSPNGGKALFAGIDGIMSLWDLETGEEIRSFSGYPAGEVVFSVAFSPDGRTGLSGSYSNDSMIVWDLESGEILQRIVTGGNFTTLFVNPDGRTAFSNGGPILLDLETGQVVRLFSVPNCCTGFAIHPNGRTIFTGGFGEDTFLREWDLETDREKRILGETEGFRTRVEVSEDGRILLSSEWNGKLTLYDLETGQELHHFNSDTVMLDIDMSPDGSKAISPGANGTAILWDLGLPVGMDEVRDWIDENRYIRDLSCEDRELYRIEPLCEAS